MISVTTGFLDVNHPVQMIYIVQLSDVLVARKTSPYLKFSALSKYVLQVPPPNLFPLFETSEKKNARVLQGRVSLIYLRFKSTINDSSKMI